MAAPVSVAKITQFPDGLSSFGMPVIGGGSIMTTGAVWFVDSTSASKGDDALHGTTPLAPFATLDFAIGQCGAGRGDVIFVLPGHVETITAAAGINCDVQGIRIVGLPETGGRSRPTFTFSTSVNASLAINAPNVTIQGLVLNFTGIDALVAPIDVNQADFVLAGCEIIFASGAGQVVDCIVTDANASRMRIIWNYFNGGTSAGPSSVVSLVGASDGIEVGYNRITGSFSNAAIYNPTVDVCTNLYIHDNQIYTTGASQSGINVVCPTATGLIARNTILCSDLTLALINNVVAAIQNFGYDTDAANAQAVPIPLVGTQLPVSASLLDNIIGNQFSYNRANKVTVVADFSSATWNTIASHEIFVVTGACRVRIIALCTIDLTSGGAATVQLGDETDTTSMVAATTATAIDAGEFWLAATAGKIFNASQVIDKIISDYDIGYAIATAAMTAGSITFTCYWEPLNGSGSVAAGTGGSL